MEILDKFLIFTDTPLLIAVVGLFILTMALLRLGRTRLPPGPRKWPVLGNLPQLAGDKMFYEKLKDLRKQYGDMVFITLGSLKIFVVYGHDLVEEVLGPRDEEFKYRPQGLFEIQKLELFKGMVWSHGGINRVIRDFVRPAFHPGVGNTTLEERIQQEAGMLMRKIAEHNGDPVNLMNMLKLAICNINYSIVFGFRVEHNDPDFLHFTEMMDQLLQRQGIKNPLNFFPILQKLPQKARQSQDVMLEIKSYINSRIEKTRESYSDLCIRSLLDLYIHRCNKTDSETISDDTVCHIVRDLFVAGTENVAIAVQWLIAYMVSYPEVQFKCREYIHEVIGDNGEVKFDDIKRLPFIEATINEVLRLANIAPLSVPHATMSEVEFNGFTIPKDTMVLTHLESVHMDPKYWECPSDFRPERFLDDGKVINKKAYYPFSMGSRCCPADKLAMMEIFIILCKCLNGYSLKLPEGSVRLGLKGIQPGAFVEPPPFDVCCSFLK